MEPIRIVIADDHAVVRAGLRLVLDAEEDLEVVAEAGEIDTTRRMVAAHRPAVIRRVLRTHLERLARD